jgi:hypothetical protein
MTSLFGYLGYRDADAAMAWLEAIGFQIGRSTGNGLYLLVDDVDAIYAAAIQAGAISVFEPKATEWGSRRARVLDPGRSR